MPEEPKNEKSIHEIFVVSVFLKGLNAVLEIISGGLFLVSGSVSTFIAFLVNKELVEDPADFVATHVQGIIPYLATHSQLFIAFYLLSHGIIKIFLVWGLLKNRLWAYPASIFFLIAFIVSQVIRYTYTHSVFLIFLTLFDVFVLWLVWHEYRYIKSKRA